MAETVDAARRSVARLRSPGWIGSYVAAVSIAGAVVLFAFDWGDGLRSISRAPGTFWLLGLLVVVGELFAIRLPRLDETEEITTSTTFAFALMLGWGTGVAALAMVAAVLAADLARKPWWKVAFNTSAYVLSISAAGAVYERLGGSTMLSLADAWPIVFAGVTFFVVNTAIVEVAVAISQGLPPLYHFRRNLTFQFATTGILLSLAPIVVVLAQQKPFLLPLLALPVASVHWSARTSVENTQLEELNRMKDDLMAVVSHELRTPLTSIQGYVKTLLQIGDRLDSEESREFLEGASRQSERLHRLIEELLTVARLDGQVESVELSDVVIPDVTGRVVQELRGHAERHRLELVFDADVPAVRSDGAKVHRIVSNLVENALKYAPADTHVWVRARASGEGVVVGVEDQGPGIPEDARDRIFDRFYQVDQGATRKVGGTGLGLYICRRLAETIGATLELERTGEDGSVFSLSIPSEPPRWVSGGGRPGAGVLARHPSRDEAGREHGEALPRSFRVSV